MRDLSGLSWAKTSMWPTSQEGGNMVHDNGPAMTAPGSAPATPVPRSEAQSDPSVDLGTQIPVGTAPARKASNTSFSPSPATWKAVTDG